MSLVVRNARYRMAPHTPCFRCNEPIGQGAYVNWRGFWTDIALHPTCAKELGAHLVKDGLLGSTPASLERAERDELQSQQDLDASLQAA